MRIEPRGIWSLIGLELGSVYPTVVDCPLCGANSKLEVRTTDHIYCRGCHFSGDLIALLAQKRDEPIADILEDLKTRALLDNEPHNGKNAEGYIIRYARQKKLKEMVLRQANWLRESCPGSINAVLSILGVRYSEHVFRQLLPHVCMLRRKDFYENDLSLPDTAKATKTWWGRYTALAVPAWEGPDIAGFWLITTKGHNYLPVTADARFANGFGCTPSVTDDVLFVVDDITTAIRCSIWSILETGRLTAFVAPYGVYDNAETYQCGRTIFWTPEGESRWYLRAIRTPTAQVLDHEEVAVRDLKHEYPCGGCFAQFKHRAVESLPAHQACAYHLLKLKADQARVVLNGSSVDPTDRARILAYAQGDDANHLADMFESTIENQAVTWNGAVISDTPQGWACKGKIISSVKLIIDEVRPQPKINDALIVGHLVYERRSYRFREKLSTLRRNTAAWIQAHIVKHAAIIPYVSKAWSDKLIEVAQQFHVPTPVMSDQQYGWGEDAETLLMPHFAVDQNNIYTTQSMVDGPRMVMPAPMTKSEWRAFHSKSFCRLALALLGNMIRTRSNQAGVGVMLTNEPHVVSRLAGVFLTDVVVNPSEDAVISNDTAPLPLFTEWREYKLREVFDRPGFKNIVFSTDSHTTKLSRINPDWLQLRVGTSIDYQALRAIFHLLPRLMRSRGLEIGADTFYRDIAECVALDIGEHVATGTVKSAALELDHYSSYRSGTAASRIMELIHYGMKRGDIHPAVREEYVKILKEEFLVATASPVIPMPPTSELNDRLREARYLVDAKKFKNTVFYESRNMHWLIDRNMWDVHNSLHATETAQASQYSTPRDGGE